jgi:hypothetical protein
MNSKYKKKNGKRKGGGGGGGGVLGPGPWPGPFGPYLGSSLGIYFPFSLAFFPLPPLLILFSLILFF